MPPRLRDMVDYRGTAFLVAGLIEYRLPARRVWLARLVSGERVLYLEPGRSWRREPNGSDEARPYEGSRDDRAIVLAEIHALDITVPPPVTIYHDGESFLLRFSGIADAVISGEVPDRPGGPCTLWRYRAAGDRFLQIEGWPDGIRMLEGASVHEGMIEVRPGPSS